MSQLDGMVFRLDLSQVRWKQRMVERLLQKRQKRMKHRNQKIVQNVQERYFY